MSNSCVECKYCDIDYEMFPGDCFPEDMPYRKAICMKNNQEIISLVHQRFVYDRLREVGVPQWCPLL